MPTPNQDNKIATLQHLLRCFQEVQCVFPSPGEVTHWDVVHLFVEYLHLDMSQTLEDSIRELCDYILVSKYHKHPPKGDFTLFEKMPTFQRRGDLWLLTGSSDNRN